MITHLPLYSHSNPKSVLGMKLLYRKLTLFSFDSFFKYLVIGGGDGGVLRELTKHKSIESITLCEIDQMVMDVSKKFLPTLALGFLNPLVTVYCGDGIEYLKQHKKCYDVIITDRYYSYKQYLIF